MPFLRNRETLARHLGGVSQMPTVFAQDNSTTPPAAGWQPDPAWQMEQRLADYAGTYAARLGTILTTSSTSTYAGGANAYRFSDNPSVLKTAAETHVWNDDNAPTDFRGHKFRWIIYYYTSANVAFTSTSTPNLDSRYVVFDAVNITDISRFASTTDAGYLRKLESFAFINGAQISTGITNYSNFLFGALSLRAIPEYFQVAAATNLSGLFSYCYALDALPDGLNTANCTNFTNFCQQCSALYTIPRQLDLSSATVVTGMFTGSSALTNGSIRGVPINLNLSAITSLSPAFLINTVRDLPDMTATPRTLTIGSTNLAKISTTYAADISAANAKGWTIA